MVVGFKARAQLSRVEDTLQGFVHDGAKRDRLIGAALERTSFWSLLKPFGERDSFRNIEFPSPSFLFAQQRRTQPHWMYNLPNLISWSGRK
jgi:hypothetical protein